MQYSFLASYVLILGALWYSYQQHLGLEKQLMVRSLLAMVQLVLLGYGLVYLFGSDDGRIVVGVLIAMVMFATWTAHRRSGLGHRGWWIALQSLGLSFVLIFGSMWILGVIGSKANEMIPIGGMILGNALNVYTQSIERFRAEVRNTLPMIEGMSALGAPLHEALRGASHASIKASMIPTLNMLQTVGIIHIPGITVGMLLAGASPLSAIGYQLAIMYMMVAIALVCAWASVTFSYRWIIASIHIAP